MYKNRRDAMEKMNRHIQKRSGICRNEKLKANQKIQYGTFKSSSKGPRTAQRILKVNEKE